MELEEKYLLTRKTKSGVVSSTCDRQSGRRLMPSWGRDQKLRKVPVLAHNVLPCHIWIYTYIKASCPPFSDCLGHPCLCSPMSGPYLRVSVLLRAILTRHENGSLRVERRGFHTLVLFINPRRACAARVGLCVCLSVCVSVTTFFATVRNKAAKKRYQRVQRYTGLI